MLENRIDFKNLKQFFYFRTLLSEIEKISNRSSFLLTNTKNVTSKMRNECISVAAMRL